MTELQANDIFLLVQIIGLILCFGLGAISGGQR